MATVNLKLLESVTIRPALKSDLEHLEWGGELIHFRNIFSDAYRNVEKGEGQIWVAESKTFGVIGQAIISLDSERRDLSDGQEKAYLYGFRVMPEFRNQGIGTLIMQHIELDLFKQGFKKITLNVARDNIKALQLYNRLGYRIMGAESGEWSFIDHLGYKRFVHEPAWRMEKELRKS